jgi:hypothetical protein
VNPGFELDQLDWVCILARIFLSMNSMGEYRDEKRQMHDVSFSYHSVGVNPLSRAQERNSGKVNGVRRSLERATTRMRDEAEFSD